MSTNYYLRQKGESGDGLHIGLWAADSFTFHAYPEEGLTSAAAWKERLRTDAGEIFNEYDTPVSRERLFALASDGRRPQSAQFLNSPMVTEPSQILPDMRYKDAEGYLFGNYNFS